MLCLALFCLALLCVALPGCVFVRLPSFVLLWFAFGAREVQGVCEPAPMAREQLYVIHGFSVAGTKAPSGDSFKIMVFLLQEEMGVSKNDEECIISSKN